MDNEELLKTIAETIRKGNEEFQERKLLERMERDFMIETFDRKVAQAREQEKKQKKQVKTFSEYFALEYRETLPQALKMEFAKDEKLTLAILVFTLQFGFANPILILQARELKALFLQ